MLSVALDMSIVASCNKQPLKSQIYHQRKKLKIISILKKQQSKPSNFNKHKKGSADVQVVNFSLSVVYPYKKRIMTDNDFELLNSSTAWLNDTVINCCQCILRN